MKTRGLVRCSLALAMALLLGVAWSGPRFVDLDGDGFHDEAPDHDGDGLPDCVDPDARQTLRGQGPWRAQGDSLRVDSLLYRGYVERHGFGEGRPGPGAAGGFGWEGWAPGPRGGRFLTDPNRRGNSPGGGGGGGGGGNGHGQGGH